MYSLETFMDCASCLLPSAQASIQTEPTDTTRGSEPLSDSSCSYSMRRAIEVRIVSRRGASAFDRKISPSRGPLFPLTSWSSTLNITSPGTIWPNSGDILLHILCNLGPAIDETNVVYILPSGPC